MYDEDYDYEQEYCDGYEQEYYDGYEQEFYDDLDPEEINDYGIDHSDYLEENYEPQEYYSETQDNSYEEVIHDDNDHHRYSDGSHHGSSIPPHVVVPVLRFSKEYRRRFDAAYNLANRFPRNHNYQQQQDEPNATCAGCAVFIAIITIILFILKIL